jgi:osmotically-inducible protein OsmY
MSVDTKIRKRIVDTITRDQRLSGSRISVKVRNRVATLSGTVYSYRRKLAAMEVAESTLHCSLVVDDIKVVPPLIVSDQDVANNVRVILAAHADIKKEVITVSVKDGKVILEGNASSIWERMLAEDLTLGARGVRKVENLLLVDISGNIEDEALMRNIDYDLKNTRGLNNVDVNVAVTGGKAVLSGMVNEDWQRKLAERVVSRFRVTQIHNDIALADTYITI